jgi:hypothetical protein
VYYLCIYAGMKCVFNTCFIMMTAVCFGTVCKKIVH